MKKIDLSKAKLPRGYAKEIARKLDISPNTVYHEKYGQTQNLRVRLELLKVAEYHQETTRILEQAIQDTEKRMTKKKDANQLCLF